MLPSNGEQADNPLGAVFADFSRPSIIFYQLFIYFKFVACIYRVEEIEGSEDETVSLQCQAIIAMTGEHDPRYEHSPRR